MDGHQVIAVTISYETVRKFEIMLDTMLHQQREILALLRKQDDADAEAGRIAADLNKSAGALKGALPETPAKAG